MAHNRGFFTVLSDTVFSVVSPTPIATVDSNSSNKAKLIREIDEVIAIEREYMAEIKKFEQKIHALLPTNKNIAKRGAELERIKWDAKIADRANDRKQALAAGIAEHKAKVKNQSTEVVVKVKGDVKAVGSASSAPMVSDVKSSVAAQKDTKDSKAPVECLNPIGTTRMRGKELQTVEYFVKRAQVELNRRLAQIENVKDELKDVIALLNTLDTSDVSLTPKQAVVYQKMIRECRVAANYLKKTLERIGKVDVQVEITALKAKLAAAKNNPLTPGYNTDDKDVKTFSKENSTKATAAEIAKLEQQLTELERTKQVDLSGLAAFDNIKAELLAVGRGFNFIPEPAPELAPAVAAAPK